MKRMKMILLAMMLAVTCSGQAVAKGEYQTAKSFIVEALGSMPKAQSYWLTADDKSRIAGILQHPFQGMRIRYWRHEQQTVWILNEIGKEQPITVGIHINGLAIAKVAVLSYRESRGDEVRHAFFTDQFKQARLGQDDQLSQHIDGITGATLSVRALTKTSRLALWLAQKVAHVANTETE